MAQAAPETDRDHHVCYTTHLQHLSDEMKRIDSLIRLLLAGKHGPQAATPADKFRGLVLHEEEISGLLGEQVEADENTVAGDDREARSLVESLSRLEASIQRRRAASAKNGVNLPLAHLSRLFDLTRFEESCLLICLAAEVSRKYRKLYAYLQDDITRKQPSIELMLDLLCRSTKAKISGRSAFDSQAPLLKYKLLRVGDSLAECPPALLSRPVSLDDRVANFLLGFGHMDFRLEGVAALVSPQDDLSAGFIDEEAYRSISEFIHAHFIKSGPASQNAVFYFSGPRGSGKSSLAKLVCKNLALPLVVGDLSAMLAGQVAFEEAIWLLGREAALQSAALCLTGFDCLLGDDDKQKYHLRLTIDAIRAFSRLTFLTGNRQWKPQGLLKQDALIHLDFPTPDYHARKSIWEGHFEQVASLASDVDPGVLAGRFRFTPGQIQDAVIAARNLARWRSPGELQIKMEDLSAACRAQSDLKLGRLARKIEPKYTWGDLVLPADQMAQLREICGQARYRHVVYDNWGFSRKLSLGRGLTVLASGPPGTGKTMSAEVLAGALELDLYKIDLSQVVSKYIGETEKNLHHVFQEAQSSCAILFFDEADALFGKRSEVKDAHDRYANIEVSYLLQKMEEYDGIAILATNFRQNLDEAFVRRMQFIIEFSFPDEDCRRRIWQTVFPAEAPVSSEVDFDLLAREIRLAGGNIKNIALAAAFSAASNGRVIGMSHLLQATRREFQKLGRTWNEPAWTAQPASES
jgi:SpoVK/Ycf46/Vps4 family AAA+-type ATPase